MHSKEYTNHRLRLRVASTLMTLSYSLNICIPPASASFDSSSPGASSRISRTIESSPPRAAAAASGPQVLLHTSHELLLVLAYRLLALASLRIPSPYRHRHTSLMTPNSGRPALVGELSSDIGLELEEGRVDPGDVVGVIDQVGGRAVDVALSPSQLDLPPLSPPPPPPPAVPRPLSLSIQLYVCGNDAITRRRKHWRSRRMDGGILSRSPTFLPFLPCPRRLDVENQGGERDFHQRAFHFSSHKHKETSLQFHEYVFRGRFVYKRSEAAN
jgi:hypothetical protein